ncbi:unnamed protein product [Prorocentrum cordatum]|uniref:Uncharacterized protein n=1 Tax=Prorocentrum cordatum TaxID=2364126 RepID=A0ABN9V0Y7_9DINO|nr:unnamed protein product [Polarella glacialis]
MRARRAPARTSHRAEAQASGDWPCTCLRVLLASDDREGATPRTGPGTRRGGCAPLFLRGLPELVCQGLPGLLALVGRRGQRPLAVPRGLEPRPLGGAPREAHALGRQGPRVHPGGLYRARRSAHGLWSGAEHGPESRKLALA